MFTNYTLDTVVRSTHQIRFILTFLLNSGHGGHFMTNQKANNEHQASSIICSTWNLPIERLQKLDVNLSSSGEDDIYEITLNPSNQICPYCCSGSVNVKGYTNRKIAHTVVLGRQSIIRYRARRYICKKCGKTFLEHNPFTHFRQRVSVAVIDNVMRDLKKQNETFTSVANRYNISPTTVQNIFDRHFCIGRIELPEYILIDENYAFHSKRLNSKYICVMMDYQKRSVFEVLESRHRDVLSDYFFQIPISERSKVKAICSDMYDVYRDICSIYFPNAVHCVDRFHLIQELNRSIDAIRKQVMHKYNKSDCNYYLLKKFKWMLFKENDQRLFDENGERKYNKKLRESVNLANIYTKLLSIDSSLEIGCNIRFYLSQFYEKAKSRKFDRDEAINDLESIIFYCNHSGIPEYKSFSKTLNGWKKSIINSIYVIDNGAISNGIMENRNKLIKDLKYNANGYKNFERFRNRIIYCLNSESVYMGVAYRPVVEQQRLQNKENAERRKRGESRTYKKHSKDTKGLSN